MRMVEDCTGFRRCDHRGTVIRDRQFLPLSGSAAAYQISGPDAAGTFPRPTQRADFQAWKKAVARSPVPGDDADDPPQRSVSAAARQLHDTTEKPVTGEAIVCGVMRKITEGTARYVYEAASVRCDANDAGHLWSRNGCLMPIVTIP